MLPQHDGSPLGVYLGALHGDENAPLPYEADPDSDVLRPAVPIHEQLVRATDPLAQGVQDLVSPAVVRTLEIVAEIRAGLPHMIQARPPFVPPPRTEGASGGRPLTVQAPGAGPLCRSHGAVAPLTKPTTNRARSAARTSISTAAITFGM